MIDLGLQANISILGAQTCTGAVAALNGRFTLNQALDRLAAGRCAFQVVDARTVRLSALPAAPPPPVRAVAPAPPRRPAAITPAHSVERREAPMSEIVVTATKRDLSLRAAAAAVSIVGGDALRGSNTVDSAGAAAQIAGVVITNLGPGRDKILLRGMSDGAFTGRTRSTVGIYLDDAPITYNAPDPSLRLVDIDRIEVIRGPQGALYGAGLLSGVFRIVTNKPDPDAPAARLSASIGDTQSGAGSRAVDGMINLPLSSRAALRVVGYHAVDGGYLDDVNLRLSDVDRTTRDGGRIALAAQTDQGWNIDAYAALQHLATNDTQYVTTAPRLQRANKVREAHNNDFAQAAVTVRRAFDGFRLQSATGVVQHRYSSTFDASAALSRFDQNDADLGVYREGATVDMLVQDTFLASRGDGPFDWLIGVYGAKTSECAPASAARRRSRSIRNCAATARSRRRSMATPPIASAAAGRPAPGRACSRPGCARARWSSRSRRCWVATTISPGGSTASRPSCRCSTTCRAANRSMCWPARVIAPAASTPPAGCRWSPRAPRSAPTGCRTWRWARDCTRPAIWT